ncbi:Bug family tripartite tricarboxylate transporter substrate binding protein [Roseomonas sp. BN140053]|uniref:Bug family tripartite tricarboxylate transporter substrate binding protein n=1 Tax=Roseomonas sp. BN140053 TaxID=3391898 RepID=UPI0039EC32A2
MTAPFPLGRRAALRAAGAAPLLGILPRPARAEPVLDRVARMVVGYPAGGAADVIARLFAERLRGLYAPQVIVENRTGASARLAVDAVRKAAPDGTTMLFTPEAVFTIYPHTYPKSVRYDAWADFAPVSGLSVSVFGFVVDAKHPARDLDGFVRWAREQGEVPYATPSAGSTLHFLTEQMARSRGLRMQHVAYRGTGPALLDMAGGRLAAVTAVLSDVMEGHRAGTMRILAITAAARSPKLPDVPTFAELGYPEQSAEAWYAMLLPGGTPAPIVEGLQRAIETATRDPQLRDALLQLEQAPLGTTAAALAERLRAERDRWGPIVRDTGYTAEE